MRHRTYGGVRGRAAQVSTLLDYYIFFKKIISVYVTSVRHKKLDKVLILICYLNNCNKIDLKFHEVVLKQDRYSYIFQRLKRRMHAVPRRDFLFY